MKPVQSKSKPKGEQYLNGVPQSFVPRDLTKVNPKSEQFEPTAAEPVRQRYKMAGGC